MLQHQHTVVALTIGNNILQPKLADSAHLSVHPLILLTAW